jgi:hypothetical protein
MGLTVRISSNAHESLREIAQADHEPMQSVLDKAIEEYRRKRFLEDLNRAYAELRVDQEAWKEEEAERRLWDQTLADGLLVGETWEESGRPVIFHTGQKHK